MFCNDYNIMISILFKLSYICTIRTVSKLVYNFFKASESVSRTLREYSQRVLSVSRTLREYSLRVLWQPINRQWFHLIVIVLLLFNSISFIQFDITVVPVIILVYSQQPIGFTSCPSGAMPQWQWKFENRNFKVALSSLIWHMFVSAPRGFYESL